MVPQSRLSYESCDTYLLFSFAPLGNADSETYSGIFSKIIDQCLPAITASQTFQNHVVITINTQISDTKTIVQMIEDER